MRKNFGIGVKDAGFIPSFSVGHIFGLSHCKNYCVMQFSMNVKESCIKTFFNYAIIYVKCQMRLK
ncbi:MAG: hypothetical protein J7K47_03425 [Thermoplasmata archaeon]|nr:hypothetical protein [Thermoplasmata archaeon]